MISNRKEKVLAVMREYKIQTIWLSRYLPVHYSTACQIIYSQKDSVISDYYYIHISKALNRIVKALGYREVPLEMIPEMDFIITTMDEYGIPEKVLLRQLRANNYKLKQSFKNGLHTKEDYAAMITAINQLKEKGGKHYEYY